MCVYLNIDILSLGNSRQHGRILFGLGNIIAIKKKFPNVSALVSFQYTPTIGLTCKNFYLATNRRHKRATVAASLSPPLMSDSRADTASLESCDDIRKSVAGVC